jgi:hypothetical protein
MLRVVEILIPVVIVLVIVAVLLGRARDSSLAKRIGHEVNAQAPAEDPVLLLEKLNQLREAGALTEAEYEAQKARILEG